MSEYWKRRLEHSQQQEEVAWARVRDLENEIERLHLLILEVPHKRYCEAKRWVPGECTCFRKRLLAKLDN